MKCQTQSSWIHFQTRFHLSGTFPSSFIHLLTQSLSYSCVTKTSRNAVTYHCQQIVNKQMYQCTSAFTALLVTSEYIVVFKYSCCRWSVSTVCSIQCMLYMIWEEEPVPEMEVQHWGERQSWLDACRSSLSSASSLRSISAMVSGLMWDSNIILFLFRERFCLSSCSMQADKGNVMYCQNKMILCVCYKAAFMVYLTKWIKWLWHQHFLCKVCKHLPTWHINP